MFYESACIALGRYAAQVEAIKEEIDYENTLADLRSMITDCHDGAERIRDVVQNLRTFSRLDEAEYKKVDYSRRHRIDPAPAVALLQLQTASRCIATTASLPPVDCYAGQLNQVWMNLLVNAAQAVGQSGAAKCASETRREGETVIVSISDTG